MARQDFSASSIGVWLIFAAALAGLAVSSFNYLDPQSGIAGEPGTILVIVSTAILTVLAWLMKGGGLRSRFLRRFITLAAILDIAGTAFAGYLLHSQTLVILMFVAFLGWIFYMLAPRPAVA